MNQSKSVSRNSQLESKRSYLPNTKELMKVSLSYPSYLKLYEAGELEKRVEEAYKLLGRCNICPRECGVNRLKGEKGFCKVDAELMVSSFHSHFGEEPPISGYRGSGTIFFTHCNLRCLFCQNYPISHLGNGNQISPSQLSQMMLSLQKRGCHNINLVTPTHFTPQILSGLFLAVKEGLNIPLVYNSSGYEKVETLRLLEDVVDIYMPDIKYGEEEKSRKFSSAPDYFEVAKKAIKEMYRQVGNLKLNGEGIAQRGLLVRHLILPNKGAGTRKVFSFLREEISPAVYLSIMSQYFPAHKAGEVKELNRRVTREEYKEALRIASELGLGEGWRQD